MIDRNKVRNFIYGLTEVSVRPREPLGHWSGQPGMGNSHRSETSRTRFPSQYDGDKSGILHFLHRFLPSFMDRYKFTTNRISQTLQE